MKGSGFSHEQLVHIGKLTPEDFQEIHKRCRPDNRLGFAYQLDFVRLVNHFPIQQPFEIADEMLTFVSVQIDILRNLSRNTNSEGRQSLNTREASASI